MTYNYPGHLMNAHQPKKPGW